MCGIVGMVAKNSGGFWGWSKDFFEEMLHVDAVRGYDSTGAFLVTNKNSIDSIKQAADPNMLFRTQSWKNFKDEIGKRGMIVVGHNRKASVGAIVAENAHPFVDQSIALVHNGYISNHKVLDDKVDVDSEAIITALRSEPDYLKGLDKLSGAWAIVWYDHTKKTLYLTRNSERPLSIVHTDNAMYFASESGMLEWLFSRHRIQHQDAIELRTGLVYEVTWKPFAVTTKELPTRIFTPVVRDMRKWLQSEILEGDVCGLDPAAFQDNTFEPTADDMAADAEFVLDPRESIGEGKPYTFGKPPVNEFSKETDLVKRWFRQYPQGSSALFEPRGFTSVNKSTTVFGSIWVPGLEVCPAIYIPKETEEEIWIDSHYPLTATIGNIQRRDKEAKIVLSKLRRPTEILKDAIGQQMSYTEWQMICERISCDKCAKPPQTHQPEFTQISRLIGTYSLVCMHCLYPVSNPRKAVPLDDKTDKPSINDHDDITKPGKPELVKAREEAERLFTVDGKYEPRSEYGG